MTELGKVKLPIWFWIVAGILVLWNIMGCVTWVRDVMMTEDMMAQLPPEQQALYSERPEWIVPVYALAVFAALAGSILLILKNKLAIPLYAVSLVAVVAQFGYVLFVMDAIGSLGFVQAAALPIFIFVAGVFELWFAFMAKGKGWLV